MQCMDFFKPFFDSLFQDSPRCRPPPPEASESSPVTAATATGPRTTALKLKGYFELAKEEIDKAIRAEQWGIPDDALAHYKNAQKVMSESQAVIVTDAPLSPREEEEVGNFQQKISKWQGEVSERVRVLRLRTDAAAKKITPSYVSSTFSSTQKTTHVGSFRRNQQATGYRKRVTGEQKSSSEATSNYDTRLVEIVNSTIVDKSPSVKWKDVAGLDQAKQALMEMVILPSKRRDLFTGLRKPARGLLLFGPPGNGKTLLAKAVASESQATFFSVSASSLTSKWVGEAEKLVRTLFTVAAERQPSIIFIDEIDSILSTRVANENDASRRLKSEFLVQYDGVTSNQNALVIVIGATNKPQELDDAVLRRLVKRIFIPLPDEKVRRLLLKNQLKGKAYSLPDSDLGRLAKLTNGYSGSDLQALCEEAAMMPIRELGPEHILRLNANQVRSLRYNDVQRAMTVIRPSLQRNKWKELEDWNKEFGSN